MTNQMSQNLSWFKQPAQRERHNLLIGPVVPRPIPGGLFELPVAA